jgi:two-component system chemotaxis sensor kinase CheA
MGGKRDSVTLKHFDHAVTQLTSLVGDLQNTVMKARMQPVGRVFQKYVRVARDLSRQLGKDVELVMEGENTEIDKTMLDLLNDPLTHLVRNAVDHGVDSPDERAAARKPPKSAIRLSAQQVGDRVMIEIADDGRRMRPEILREKAVEKGLITIEEGAALGDAGALNPIFLPGFSTKTEISGVSGRGVGMDVVKTNITKLNGRIQVFSVPGRGTRVVFALPLTLAILPVLVFRLTQQAYAPPLTLVREIIRLDPENVQVVSGRPSIVTRGEVLPVIALADLLKTERGPGTVGLVIQEGAESLVLAVDGFVGQDEVVIKALDKFRPKGVAGATQSDDGALVLVLDLSELLQQHGWKVAA